MDARLLPLPPLFLLLFIIFLLSCGAGRPAFAQTGEEPFSLDRSPLPPPTGYVEDYAGVIDPVVEERIEEKIRAFRESSDPPVEIGVAVVKTTGGRPIFDYSLAVARGWGIGTKADDNPGLLLFVAIDDRKYFTQVSRDLEDELPDGLAGSLQRRYLVPEFKKGNYGKGIEDTIDAYIRAIRQKQTGGAAGTTSEPPLETAPDIVRTRPRSSGGDSICNTFICLIILFVILFFTFAGRGGGGGGRRGGGGGGSDIASAVLWGVLSGLASSSSSSSSSSWGGSSSSWGGSSGGWGGFGGGGDFGGGGAGGGW